MEALGSGTARPTEPAPAEGPYRGDRLGTTTSDDPIYTAGKGIEFPFNDGFPIHLDYTAIWGILPVQAPDVVRQFGTLKDVEQKVILPQIESICRLQDRGEARWTCWWEIPASNSRTRPPPNWSGY